MATFIVTTADDELDSFGTPSIAAFGGANDISLREAIALANATVEVDTITFDPTVFDGGVEDTIVLSINDQGGLGSGNSLDIDTSMTIDGDLDDDGMPDVTVAGDPQSSSNRRIFTVDSTSSNSIEAVIDGLVITGGFASGGGLTVNFGGGIFVDDNETLTLSSSRVTGNYARSNGGGIFGDPGSRISIIESVVDSNISDNDGGGINVSNSYLYILNSSIYGNEAANRGGGFVLGGSSTGVLIGSTVSGNDSENDGGGIWTSPSSQALTILNSEITGNSSGGNGAGIEANQGRLYITNSSVTDNEAGPLGVNVNGGGINATTNIQDVVIVNSDISDNFAPSEGGGLRVTRAEADVTVLNSTFTGNQVGRSGATSSNGAGIASEAPIDIVNTTITGNIAYAGSAAACSPAPRRCLPT